MEAASGLGHALPGNSQQWAHNHANSQPMNLHKIQNRPAAVDIVEPYVYGLDSWTLEEPQLGWSLLAQLIDKRLICIC